jgi:hypothetical protein
MFYSFLVQFSFSGHFRKVGNFPLFDVIIFSQVSVPFLPVTSRQFLRHVQIQSQTPLVIRRLPPSEKNRDRGPKCPDFAKKSGKSANFLANWPKKGGKSANYFANMPKKVGNCQKSGKENFAKKFEIFW